MDILEIRGKMSGLGKVLYIEYVLFVENWVYFSGERSCCEWLEYIVRGGGVLYEV